MFNNPFSYEKAMELFSYDPVCGEIRWKNPAGTKVKSGDLAGWVNEHGRVVVRYQGKGIFGHRLAWLLHFGRWPELYLDHINGDPCDNRIENLREVTSRVNSQNMRKPSRRSTTGLLGVSRAWGGKKFISCISDGGKSIHLGTFDTPAEAHAAYVNAKRAIHAGCTL